MTLFNKKKSPAQNIAFTAIFSAITALFSFFVRIIPFVGVIFILLIPLASTLVSTLCKTRYTPIYLICSIALSILLNFGFLETTFFFSIPAIFAGFCYGILLKIKVNPRWSILLSSLIQFGWTYLSIFIFNSIYELNLIENIIAFLGLKSIDFVFNFVPSIIFILSLIQNVISFLIVKLESVKFAINFNEYKIDDYLSFAINLISIGLSILFIFINISFSYLFVFICFYISIVEVAFSIRNKEKIPLILYGVSVFVFIFAFALINSKFDSSVKFILLDILFIQLTVISFFKTLLKKKE